MKFYPKSQFFKIKNCCQYSILFLITTDLLFYKDKGVSSDFCCLFANIDETISKNFQSDN